MSGVGGHTCCLLLRPTLITFNLAEIILGDIILVWIIVILANTILVIKILASATQWSPAPSLVVSIAAIHNASFCHCLISMAIAFGFCKM